MVAQGTVLAWPDLIHSLTLIGTAPTFPSTVRKGMKARANTIREHGMSACWHLILERWSSPAARERCPDLIDRVTKTVLDDNPFVHAAAIWDLVAAMEFRDRLSNPMPDVGRGRNK